MGQYDKPYISPPLSISSYLNGIDSGGGEDRAYKGFNGFSQYPNQAQPFSIPQVSDYQGNNSFQNYTSPYAGLDEGEYDAFRNVNSGNLNYNPNGSGILGITASGGAAEGLGDDQGTILGGGKQNAGFNFGSLGDWKTGAQIFGSLFGAYNANKARKLAEKDFAFNKQTTLRNLANQERAYNDQVSQRALRMSTAARDDKAQEQARVSTALSKYGVNNG